MEREALALGTAIFEKLGNFDENFLYNFLYQIFQTMDFYRNNTKNKLIPQPITRNIFSFFATFMVNNGVQSLETATNKVQ